MASRQESAPRSAAASTRSDAVESASSNDRGRGELRAKRFHGAMQPLLGCTRCDVEQLADFGVRIALDHLEHDHRAQVFGEGIEGGGQRDLVIQRQRGLWVWKIGAPPM